MTPIVLLSALVATPIALAILFRVSAVFVFFSVAAGALLASSIGDDVVFALETLVRGVNATTIINLALITIPVALTIYFLRKSLPHTQLLLHLLPLIASGLLFATVVMAEFSPGLQGSIRIDGVGNAFYQAGDLIIATAALLNLFLAWRIYRHKRPHHKKHK